MREIRAATELHKQVSADEIRQARAILDSGMQLNRSGRLELRPHEHFPDLFQRRPILQREGSQASQHVLQAHDFRRAIHAPHANEELSRRRVIMY